MGLTNESTDHSKILPLEKCAYGQSFDQLRNILGKITIISYLRLF